MRFQDRADAGRALARSLSAYAGKPRTIVLALPRGGVPVAFEVARALHAPLDVFVVRKIGVPGQEELALGAVASDGIRVLNDDVVEALGFTETEIAPLELRELREVTRLERLYRGDRPVQSLSGKIVIVIDDGLATGATMRAAARAIRSQMPARLVVSVPVGAKRSCDELRADADEVICALTPEPFHAVGLWYEDFEQTTDDEVRRLLTRFQTRADA